MRSNETILGKINSILDIAEIFNESDNVARDTLYI